MTTLVEPLRECACLGQRERHHQHLQYRTRPVRLLRLQAAATAPRLGPRQLHRLDSMTDRFFSNDLPDWLSDGQVEVDTAVFRHALSDTVEQVVRARHAGDPFVYVGSSGVAYMLWHIATAGGPPRRSESPIPAGVVVPNWIERGLRYTRAAVQDIQQFSKEQYGVSLLCGASGVLVVAALMAHAASQARRQQGKAKESELLAAEVQGYVRQFNSIFTIAVSPRFKEDEFLYGRAGYLQGALLLNRVVGQGQVPIQNIQLIIDAILRSGRRTASAVRSACPLYYVWPPGRGQQPYLGAAHGLMGVLHVLLHVRGQLQRSTRAELETCLRYVLSTEEDAEGRPGPHGHYPTILGDAPGRAPLVHWCHGAPGAVMLFAKAYQEYRNADYLAAAQRAGEAVWQRGLLRKGPGVCHGVAGSAYAMLTLYRVTDKQQWLHRAVQMGLFMQSQEFKEAARVPDRPFSLYEGLAGAACLYADLLNPKTSAFPLFELRPSDQPEVEASIPAASSDSLDGSPIL